MLHIFGRVPRISLLKGTTFHGISQACPEKITPLLFIFWKSRGMEKLVLTLDKENWKFGNAAANCNIFLSVFWGEIAPPPFWLVLKYKKRTYNCNLPIFYTQPLLPQGKLLTNA
jgi:hypothetical protein